MSPNQPIGLQVEAQITSLQALLADVSVAQAEAAAPAAEAAAAVKRLLEPLPAPEAFSSSDDISMVRTYST